MKTKRFYDKKPFFFSIHCQNIVVDEKGCLENLWRKSHSSKTSGLCLLTQFCVCWLRKSIRKSLPTIPLFQHNLYFGHIHRVLIRTFILFYENRISLCNSDSIFFSLLNFCISSFLQFFSIFLFSVVLFLSWFRLLCFCGPFSFILLLSFFLAFFLSLNFLFPHFSLSLSLSLSISFLCCSLIPFFLFFCLLLIHFFVSSRFSVSSWCSYGFCCNVFFLFSPLSSFLIFLSLFLVYSPFFAFRSHWLSPRLVFSVTFSAFNLLLFCLLGFCSYFQIYLLSDSLYFSAANDLSLSLLLYTSFYLFWFFNTLWERLLLLTCIKLFFDIFGSLHVLLVCPKKVLPKSLKRSHVHPL